ncbi:hypothetical protein [Paenibacillus hexagrammi]|nr:hypothetical protein [Paenibacillus sp. YPD9-1]
MKFPWESSMMIDHRWYMQTAMVSAALGLSLMSWYRRRKGGK